MVSGNAVSVFIGCIDGCFVEIMTMSIKSKTGRICERTREFGDIYTSSQHRLMKFVLIKKSN